MEAKIGDLEVKGTPLEIIALAKALNMNTNKTKETKIDLSSLFENTKHRIYKKKKGNRKHKMWKRSENSNLKKYAKEGKFNKQIAKLLGRTSRSVYMQRRKMRC